MTKQEALTELLKLTGPLTEDGTFQAVSVEERLYQNQSFPYRHIFNICIHGRGLGTHGCVLFTYPTLEDAYGQASLAVITKNQENTPFEKGLVV